jgi:hypothetical protein
MNYLVFLKRFLFLARAVMVNDCLTPGRRLPARRPALMTLG